MNIYDVYMDVEEAVISADRFEITIKNDLFFSVEGETVAYFKSEVWRWFEKRQVEEN